MPRIQGLRFRGGRNTLLLIIEMGGGTWRNLGTEKSGGTKLWSVSGHVKKPGVYELPMGYSDMESFIMEDCGGMRRPVEPS